MLASPPRGPYRGGAESDNFPGLSRGLTAERPEHGSDYLPFLGASRMQTAAKLEMCRNKGRLGCLQDKRALVRDNHGTVAAGQWYGLRA